MRTVWAWLSSRSTGFKAIAATITTVGTLVGIVATIVVLSRGEDESSLDTSLALAAAVSRVQDAGSSRIEIRARTLGDARPDTTGHGMFDYRRRIGRLTVSRGGALRAVIVYDGDTTYARLLEFGRRWLKFTTQPGFQAGLSGLLLAPDPSQQLDYLRELANPKKVGEQSKFNVPTTHYVGGRTLEKLPQKPTVPPNATAELRREIRRRWPVARRNLDGARERIDAWVDAAGLVRSVQVTTLARRFTFRYVVDIHDFGLPVRVRIPSHS